MTSPAHLPSETTPPDRIPAVRPLSARARNRNHAEPDGRRTVALVANTGWYLGNFRRGLLERLRADGHRVVLISPADDYAQRLQASGFDWREWQLDRRGMNPAHEMRSVSRLAGIYRSVRPDLAHHFTIKCILYGTIAARLAGVRSVVNSVTGLGHVFVSRRWTARLARRPVRQLYRWALTSPGVAPMFQNADDLAVLGGAIPQLRQSAVFTCGSGVDLERFAPAPRSAGAAPFTIVFAGRLIREKGVEAFVAAARLARGRGWRFLAYGDPDPGNPSAVSAAQLSDWKHAGDVEFRGHTDDIHAALADADLVVLPSAREGFPRVLAEAAAMGVPAVATNVPGCRDVVHHGESGLLIDSADPAELLSAIESLASDPARRLAMGCRSRQIAEERFDEQVVVRATMDVYRRLANLS